MDAEFGKRWRDGHAPFDGQMVTLADLVPLPTLQEALIAIVQCLHDYRPALLVFRLEDWHEHDGWASEARQFSWDELRALISTEASLLACVRDTFVRDAFFPAERDWYLRIYVPDHFDNPRHRYDDPHLIEYGSFDLTCVEPLADQIAGALKAAGTPDVKVITAKMYFDKYAT